MTAVHEPQDPMTPVAPGAEDDAGLIRLAQQGDRDAYDRLVRRYLPRAYTVAFRVSGNRQDAEDLVQDGFMAAYRSIDRFEVGRPFGPWLYRIIINAAVSHLRREGRRQAESLPEQASAAGPTPLGHAVRGEFREQFRRTLAALPEKQRLAVQWHDVDGFTAEEIGESLGVPSGTVRWHLHQARQTLRKALAPWRGPLEDGHDES